MDWHVVYHFYGIFPNLPDVMLQVKEDFIHLARCGPITLAGAVLQSTYNRSWIIKPPAVFCLIAIVPFTDFAHRQDSLLLTQSFYFFFCKAKIFFENRVVQHGIFLKHIKRGACAVSFNRENAGHIGERHIRAVLEQVTQKFQEIALIIRIQIMAENIIPFVYDKDEFVVCGSQHIGYTVK